MVPGRRRPPPATYHRFVRIFVAGASGVISRHLVPLLVEGGYGVAGMTRTTGKVDWLRHVGDEHLAASSNENVAPPASPNESAATEPSSALNLHSRQVLSTSAA